MRKLFVYITLSLAILTQSPGWAEEFCFDEAGRTFTLPPQLLKSIAIIESGMNPSAHNQNRNGSFDLGLMQINSSWIGIARLDKERLMSDACYNTLAGARILRGCIDRHGYTWEAVGCYNAASSAKRKIYAWKVYRQLVAKDNQQQSDLESLAASAGKSHKDNQKQKNGYLSISIDNQGEETLWTLSPDPVESKVALDRKEVSP